jgi:hypothetical protein
MTGSLARASAAAVLRSPAPLLAATAGLLVLVSAQYLQGGPEHQVRLGCATLLACALAATAEEPAAEVAAATPRPAWSRGGSRLLLGLVLVVPVAVLSLGTTGAVSEGTSVGVPAVQMLALVSTGPAVGFGFMAWGRGQPAYAATVGVVCLSAALWLLPLDWSVTKVRPGLPADDLLLRCAALALLGHGVVAAAWRDPASARSRHRLRSRRSRS